MDGVSLQIFRGEKVALIGPNGAGKSTMLLVLAGLLKADKGLGMINWSPDQEREEMETAFLFQNPDDQIIATTVEDDVGFSLLRRGFAPGRVHDLVERALHQVHLGGYGNRLPQEMSFGEKKRMCLAGCLIGEPKLLFLDEPALGLDPREIDQLGKILNKIPQTLLFSSMDFQIISGLADRLILLNNGKIVKDGLPGDILSDRRLLQENGMAVCSGED